MYIADCTFAKNFCRCQGLPPMLMGLERWTNLHSKTDWACPSSSIHSKFVASGPPKKVFRTRLCSSLRDYPVGFTIALGKLKTEKSAATLTTLLPSQGLAYPSIRQYQTSPPIQFVPQNDQWSVETWSSTRSTKTNHSAPTYDSNSRHRCVISQRKRYIRHKVPLLECTTMSKQCLWFTDIDKKSA